MARKTDEQAIAAMVRRLVVVHAECTPDEMAQGIVWYGKARAAAEGMSAGDIERSAAVIAHLSPRARWSVNVAWAARILAAADAGESCPAVSVKGQRAKAWAVATRTARPDEHHGLKTLSFYRNIIGDLDAVCVDSWAARAATGDSDITQVGPAQYRRIETAYVRAARALGMAPRDLQAAVWVHIRGSAV